MRFGCSLASGKVEGSKVGCVLAIDFKYLDGGSFMDRSVYGHLCTPSGGAKWNLDGWFFDGIDDIITIPRNSVLEPQTLTLEALAWFNTIANFRVLISKANTSHIAPHYSFELWGRATNSLTFYWNDSSAAQNILVENVLVPKHWQALAGSYELRKQQVLVNGNEVGKNTRSDTIAYFDTDLILGRSRNVADSFFDGKMKQVRIYSFADYTPRILSRSIGG